jgi:hypothetical protein
MLKDELLVWFRKGVFSFVIGFIVTITLGSILAFIFASITNQFFFVTGGLPLSWLHIFPGFAIAVYDYFAFILDLLFWTFLIFLILTRKKKIKKTKIKEVKVKEQKESRLLTYFEIKPSKKEVKKFVIVSVGGAIVLIFITIVMSFIMTIPSANKTDESGDAILFYSNDGVPLSFINISRSVSYEPVKVEISNWGNLLLDFTLYVFLIFVLSYVIEIILINRRIIKKSHI